MHVSKAISAARVLKFSIAAACAMATGTVLADAKVTLTGDQEVPAVATPAKGMGTITIGSDKSVTGSVTTTGIMGMMAHIHSGAPGASGPPVITLKKDGDDKWSVPADTKLTDAQYEAYKAGNLYVNVHSADHKGGEIRGQLKP